MLPARPESSKKLYKTTTIALKSESLEVTIRNPSFYCITSLLMDAYCFKIVYSEAIHYRYIEPNMPRGWNFIPNLSG